MDGNDGKENKTALLWPFRVMIPWPIRVASVAAVLYIMFYPIHSEQVRCREMAGRLTQRFGAEARFSLIQVLVGTNRKVYIRVPASLSEQDVADVEGIIGAEDRGVSYLMMYRGKVLQASTRTR